MSREGRFENRQWNEAVRDVKRAYSRFSDFDWKADLGEPKRAATHLKKAFDDLNAAMTRGINLFPSRPRQPIRVSLRQCLYLRPEPRGTV